MSLAINDSLMMPFNGLTASFNQTYHEKVNQVERPRLNETNLDPECYKDGAQNITHSRLLRNWDWELGQSTERSLRRDTKDSPSPFKKDW